MGAVRVIDSISQTSTQRQRPPTSRSTGGIKRHPVDFKNGGALERPAREIPAVPDVPSSVPEWVRAGAFEEILFALAEYLRERGGIDIREAFIDGTFAPVKKGAPEWAR